MPVILRNILATLAGLLVGIIVISGGEGIVPKLISVPNPPLLHASQAEWLHYMNDQVPISAKLAILGLFALASFAAGYVATMAAAKGKAIVPVAVCAVVLGIAGFLNFNQIPHPLWMVIIGLAALVGAPFLGYALRK